MQLPAINPIDCSFLQAKRGGNGRWKKYVAETAMSKTEGLTTLLLCRAGGFLQKVYVQDNSLFILVDINTWPIKEFP